MKISLIICTRDRAEALAPTLAGIARLKLADGITGELIVVDNGSKDNTGQVVNAAIHAEAANPAPLPIRYIIEPGGGQSQARNTGMAAATGARKALGGTVCT